MQTDCIILGAGASGLAAACALADSGRRVVLVERLDRVGKKLLATGNGRCNLSNTDMNPAYYGCAERFVRALYDAVPPEKVNAFFSGLGLMTAQEDGRIYPRSMAAASVLDVLRAGCSHPLITVMTGCEAVSVAPSRRGGLSVQLASGEGLFAPSVIAAMGGSAAPGMGTDGTGTQMLRQLGHHITPLHPALVQLKCDHPALRSLKGQRAQAALTLVIDGKDAARETGELLFADYGVSGVCVFQLSRHVGPALAEGKTVSLRVNLLPEVDAAALGAWLSARIIARPEADALSLLTGVFPRILSLALLREAGLAQDTAASSLGPDEQRALLAAISSLTLRVTGTQGFKNAQVTRGGVSLREVDPATMASLIYDGLYICGELLDVDGPCGGYNLHFAFASALAAAEDIKRRFQA